MARRTIRDERALVALALVAACREPNSLPPKRSVVEIPRDAGPPPVSVKERVDAALARNDPPRFIRANLIAAPNLSAPVSAVKPKPAKGRILISDHVWPQRLLIDAGLDQPLENETRGLRVIAKCFAFAGRTDRTSVTLELDEPNPHVVSTPDTPFGRCFAETLAATFASPLPWKLRVDFTLRMAPSAGTSPPIGTAIIASRGRCSRSLLPSHRPAHHSAQTIRRERSSVSRSSKAKTCARCGTRNAHSARSFAHLNRRDFRSRTDQRRSTKK